MPLAYRLSLLHIILISGFKLGMAAPAEDKKGKIQSCVSQWKGFFFYLQPETKQSVEKMSIKKAIKEIDIFCGARINRVDAGKFMQENSIFLRRFGK